MRKLLGCEPHNNTSHTKKFLGGGGGGCGGGGMKINISKIFLKRFFKSGAVMNNRTIEEKKNIWKSIFQEYF